MNVGVRQLAVPDPDSATPSPAIVQYPTTAPSTGLTIGPYHFDGTLDATPAPGRFPLCVVSHGGGGSHLLYRSIGAHLAANGYVVVSPEHPRDNRNDRSESNTDRAVQHRPSHASRTIDTVLADSLLGPVVDGSRIAAIGHSMGGLTALALVGGQPWSRTRVPIATASDPRVSVAVLLAPASDWFLAPSALEAVEVPLLAIVGERDEVTPPSRIQQALEGLPAATSLTFDVVPGAGHYAFLTPFPAAMRRPDFPPATDPEGFDREAFHLELPCRIETFLAQVFRT